MFPDAYKLPGIVEVAMNLDLNGGAEACGTFIRIRGPRGSVMARVMDHCPTCTHRNQIDFKGAGDFGKIGTVITHCPNPGGREEVTFEQVQHNVGPMRIRVKEGSSQYWSQILVYDHPSPVKKVSMKLSTGWVALQRQYYNYWQVPGRPGAGARDVRVELSNGTAKVFRVDPTRSGQVF